MLLCVTNKKKVDGKDNFKGKVNAIIQQSWSDHRPISAFVGIAYTRRTGKKQPSSGMKKSAEARAAQERQTLIEENIHTASDTTSIARPISTVSLESVDNSG